MKPTSMRQVKQKLSKMYPAKKPMAFHTPVSRPAENDMSAPKPALRMPVKQVAPRPKPQLMRPKVKSPVRRRMV